VPVNHHAVVRWIERVGAQNYASALIAVATFVASGNASGRPPRWVGVGGGGHRYVTNAACGGVCVVTKQGCAITVITRGKAMAS
jgi:hypothetical protein